MAVVSKIERNPTYVFAQVTCTPAAGVGHYRQLLILSLTPVTETKNPAEAIEIRPEGRSETKLAFADYPKQEILRPVKGSFIFLSLILALLLNLLPLKGIVLTLFPDFIALTILYWCINQPQRVGMSTAFGMGLLMDIGNASTFGQHALSYSIMAFIALLFHRRLHNFGSLKQAPQMGLILLHRAICRASRPGCWMGPIFLVGIFYCEGTGTVLWPLFSSLLRISQRPRSDSNAL